MTNSSSSGATEGPNGTTSVAEGSTSEPAGSSSGSSSGGPDARYPEPGDWPPQTGPGGPSVAFEAADLFQNCAFLDGGPSDADHHNLVGSAATVLEVIVSAGETHGSTAGLSDAERGQLAAYLLSLDGAAEG